MPAFEPKKQLLNALPIQLLGGVSGLVHGSELRARFGALWESDPHSCYREGQVVECTVLSRWTGQLHVTRAPPAQSAVVQSPRFDLSGLE